MPATQISPIDRLATLSAQRTARTDRLHEATCALLSQLEDHAEVGAAVTVDACTLRLARMRSNVGYTNFWSFESDDEHVYLEKPVGFNGYLHDDFHELEAIEAPPHAALRGPSRAHLIAFGQRAARFVDALVAREEKVLAALASAQASVESATALLE